MQAYNMVESGTCESNGFSTIVGADRCAAAVHAYKNLPGEAGPESFAPFGVDCDACIDWDYEPPSVGNG
jgi:hypothetical protein